MCLYKGENKHKIAEEDIICYKLVIVNHNEILSFYQLHPIKLGQPICPAFNGVLSTMDALHSLYGEVVHAFCSKEIDSEEVNFCIKNVNWYRLLSCPILALLKCVIPKGTFYYESDPKHSEFNTAQYGAGVIVPLEIVKYYD